VPVGILTDRDIVVGLLAKDFEHIAQLDVADLVTREVVTANESDDLAEVLTRMQVQGIRRMPVVNDAGRLVGIFTLDDLLGVLFGNLAAVVSLIGRERRRESTQRT
jgi:CBS domain-containing protein